MGTQVYYMEVEDRLGLNLTRKLKQTQTISTGSAQPPNTVYLDIYTLPICIYKLIFAPYLFIFTIFINYIGSIAYLTRDLILQFGHNIA